jgi:hypothetical protein
MCNNFSIALAIHLFVTSLFVKNNSSLANGRHFLQLFTTTDLCLICVADILNPGKNASLLLEKIHYKEDI